MNELLAEVLRDGIDDEVPLALDDPRVPAAVYAHALQFRTPAHVVIDLGFGEYAIFAADGELLDLICLG